MHPTTLFCVPQHPACFNSVSWKVAISCLVADQVVHTQMIGGRDRTTSPDDVGHGAIVTTQLHDPAANWPVSFPDLAVE